MRGVLHLWRRLSPVSLLVLSFAVLVGIGTAGLLLLPGLYTGARLGPVDALFTATSAVCVTGLVVVDTATYFTFWGQLWILVLIQLGGLGIVTLTTFVIVGLGRRLSLRSEVLALPPTSLSGHREVVSLTATAALYTFGVELAGALILWGQWIPDFGARRAAWHAVFHAVSAFCNAGFSTHSTSLMGFASRPGIVLTVSFIVVLGGFGYLAAAELVRWQRAGGHRGSRRLSSHTYAVTITTAVLLLGGTLLFALFEWDGVLHPLGWVDRVVNSWFMSVTPRTAGFNTVPYDQVGNDSAFLTILLMVVGGAPGSTAGGIKVTALALLVTLAVARVRGRRYVELHARAVPEGTVQRTVSLVIGSFLVITIAILLLSVFHAPGQDLAATRQSFLPTMFETVSAFGTVGLSMGETTTLSTPGKLLIDGLMFLGRVGPLAFFAAIAVKARRLPEYVRSAHEDVIVG